MRDNSQRAKAAITLIWIILCLEFLVLISSYMQISILQEIANGLNVSQERANMNDLREGIIGILYGVVYIVSAVMYIRWFRRAYYNLHTRVKGLAFSEGWAAGSWFVPILNLFRPYQIMKELYERTHDYISARDENFKTQLNMYLVGFWWAFWVITSIVSNIQSRILLRATSPDDYLLGSQVGIASTLFGIPLCFLAVKVIRDYSKMESILYRLPPDIGERATELDFNSDENILDTFK